MSKNLSYLAGRKSFDDNLFDHYGKAAQEDGTPSKEALAALAKDFLIGDANTYGTITAYDFLKPENRDKEIYICNGSACLCAGTQDAVATEISKHFEPHQVGHMTCLGRCHENASFHYKERNYSGTAIHNLSDIIEGKDVATYEQDTYGVIKQHELLTAAPRTLSQWKTLLSTCLSHTREEVLHEVKLSKIRGRGGAGFPMGIKWESCQREVSDTKYIICNADEGDPAAFSDRYLMNHQPHALLFGMMMGGYSTGAQYGIVYIRAEYPESVRSVQAAINEFVEAGLLGNNILDTDFTFHFKVIQAKGAYICGEETALINSIEGQRPEVRTRPPFPTTQGLFMKPTVVNNVETLVAVPWILEHGGAAYASIGTETSTGTKLVSLDSYFNKPGIVEVAMGTPLSTVLYELGGGFREEVKALHIGGPLGGIVPIEQAGELAIDFGSFAAAGFLLGHASILSIPKHFPMIKYLEHLMDFAAFESCGKCFPCRLGTKRAHEMLHDAVHEMKPIRRTLFEDLLDTLQQGSLCAHGGGIPLPVRNALQYFPEELNLHFE